ncbi:hypothetical protein BO70DRAFT_337398 [Aspergillus heteromorphus CBS 117.55]|uniref:Cytochrome b5 heme-binding domain-containing protein n=1 Tax=Aspergillus heteromorphus CBS 117.55 TaxID=1448321 RepID=A0A317W1W2_9EURO|nr:uncharacterized protein BO70DRAFT_337398 [Aspergillus heteromorphus CBS 117.55]PWY80564.1 hypothetical protein BO70DRAFT_337398 [Aspergillus heteromorphus CBS 117.55]
MGWVGVATLIATACFLLYRYPPANWAPEPSTPEPPPKSHPTKPPTPQLTEDSKASGSVNPLEEEHDPENESQTTPKASASKAPVLEVPSFQLDNAADRSSPSEKSQPDHEAQNGSIRSPSQPPVQTKMGDNVLMPPPPVPQQPTASATTSSLMPPPAPPRLPSLRVPPNNRPTNNSLAPTKVIAKPSKSAKRAVLEPGYSPLDWAALTSNPNNNLRGANLPPTLVRVTPSMLKAQNGRKGTDAWTSYQGKVYNITPYLPFHPGGKGELLRGAGKDSGQLFFEIHPWVNWDAILGECLVGILVSENDDEVTENKLDAMD